MFKVKWALHLQFPYQVWPLRNGTQWGKKHLREIRVKMCAEFSSLKESYVYMCHLCLLVFCWLVRFSSAHFRLVFGLQVTTTSVLVTHS